MKGMANVSLSVTKIKTIPIVVPSQEKQRELVAFMMKCEGLKNTLHNSKTHAESMILASLSEVFQKDSSGIVGEVDAK